MFRIGHRERACFPGTQFPKLGVPSLLGPYHKGILLFGGLFGLPDVRKVPISVGGKGLRGS